MKASPKFILLTLALSAWVTLDGVASEVTQGTSPSHPHRLTLKTNKEFIGGEVRVYSGNKLLLISQRMKRKKVSIDFSDALIGEYTVEFIKGSQQEEHHYLKK
jgi:hypothetical protein